MNKKIKQTLAFSFLAFLLIGFFFWKEEFTFQSKINDTKVAAFFTVIGSVGTLVALLFLSKQTKELAKQNDLQQTQIKQSVFPDLVPFDFEFNGEEIQQSSFPVTPQPKPFISTKDATKVTIKNIGNGSAKKVTAGWMYDLKEVKDYVGKQYGIYQTIDEPIEIHFIKPEEIWEIQFSRIYLQTLGAKLNSNVQKIFDGQIDQKPMLHLAINCFDVLGYEINKCFQVSITTFENKVTVKFMDCTKQS